jgi:hypothetical protein
MPEQFSELVEIINSSSQEATIVLNGGDDQGGGTIVAGGGGEDGELILLDQLSRLRVAIDSSTAAVRLRVADGGISLTLDGARGEITVGGAGVDGNLVLQSAGGVSQDRIRLDAGLGNIWVGGNAQDGDILVFPASATDLDNSSQASIHLNGDTGNVRTRSLSLSSDGGAGASLGGGGGLVYIVAPGAALPTIQFNPQNSFMQAGNIRLDGGNGNIWVGGFDQKGDIVVFPTGATDLDNLSQASIHLDGDAAGLRLGGNNTNGTILLRGENSEERIRLNAEDAFIWVGGNNRSGDIVLYPAGATDFTNLSQATIHLDGQEANLLMGGRGADGDIFLFASDRDRTDVNDSTIHLEGDQGNLFLGGRRANGSDGVDGDIYLFSRSGDRIDVGTASIHLNGDAGDIILRNADCAEEFDVAEEIEPGTVMVLDTEGKLRQSVQPYDKKVAGVISGAGDYKPGIVLDRQQSSNARMPIALMGKVYCKVDAQYGAIEVGDLLTTSATPGHAMKADDCQRAFGSVIGKALKPLQSGCGLIPIIIALQ